MDGKGGGDVKRKKWRNVARDAGLSAGILAFATIVTGLLSRVNDDNNPFAVSMYILAIAVIARLTEGYIWGAASSLAAVFLVNIIFSEPFWAFSMSMPSYPLTFAAMLMVSLLISALTTQIKSQQKMRLEAEKEKMRANLLRAIAHDIRTPLTSIMGASSTLLENSGIGEDEKAELLGEIGRDAGWLVRITENLLTVTKFSSDGAALHKEEEVVEEIVASAVLKFRRSFPGMPVKIDTPPEILLWPMDAVLIEQVLINLMENAVSHGKFASQITLTVREEPDALRFTVEDDGAGIDPAILPRIFDGYVHENDSGKGGERRNMGIGLSVCQSIIRAHGGSIRAYNRDAQDRRGHFAQHHGASAAPNTGGAGFSFTLPAVKGDET